MGMCTLCTVQSRTWQLRNQDNDIFEVLTYRVFSKLVTHHMEVTGHSCWVSYCCFLNSTRRTMQINFTKSVKFPFMNGNSSWHHIESWNRIKWWGVHSLVQRHKWFLKIGHLNEDLCMSLSETCTIYVRDICHLSSPPCPRIANSQQAHQTWGDKDEKHTGKQTCNKHKSVISEMKPQTFRLCSTSQFSLFIHTTRKSH